MVIGPDAKPMGVMQLGEALATARRMGHDLVEISPNANPPVCKILDYGKYRYELAKKDREARKNTSATKVKELKFHMSIDEHDYHVKMRQAEGFMLKGMKVKLLMIFRGREMMHQDIGVNLMKRIRVDLSHIGTADAEPKMIGKSINMMLTPNPIQKRVRKWTLEDGPDLPEEGDEESDSTGDENTPGDGQN
jgi:translation initiation factor IF-3